MDESGRMYRGQKREKAGGDGREGEEKEKEEEEERRGRKERVRVRVRLGVGGAIRNYCGTIDKRRLRGCTTEDSLRPSDFFSSFHSLPVASLFRLFSLFPASLGLPFLASCRLIRAFTHETFQTRQYVMFEARALRHPCPASDCPTWNRRFFSILYISVDASSIYRDRTADPVNTRLHDS